MKKIFLVIVCISPSFLCSMDPEKPKMPLARSKTVDGPYTCSPSSVLITEKMSGRSKLDSDSPKPNPDLVRARSQSRESKLFVKEENANKIFPYHNSEDKK